MLEVRVDANLPNAEANSWHGLPVVRLEPTLNTPELKSRHLSRTRGEAPYIVSGCSEPDYGLLRHGLLYKYRHGWSNERTKRSPNLRLERTGDQRRGQARAKVAAGRSAASRWAVPPNKLIEIGQEYR
jgi:hypothetical protein